MSQTQSVAALSAALLSLTIAACSGSSGSGTPQGGTGSLTGTIDGNWSVRDEVIAATGICAGDVGDVEVSTYSISQSGTSLSLVSPAGTFGGTLNGQQMTLTGSVADSGGTTTITGSNITVDDTSFNGTVNWSWSDGSDSCTGQTRFTATRIVPLIADGPARALVLHDVPRLGEVDVWSANGLSRGVIEPDAWTELELAAGDRVLITELGTLQLTLDPGELRAIRLSDFR